MHFITGFDRQQTALFPQSIDELIASDHPIRFLDQFIDTLNLAHFGFKDPSKQINGRPPYRPADLLKLYIYGYMNRIRSSRALEKEYKRNIELLWLIKGLAPDHNTIANFRKDNPQAIKKVFQETVRMAKNLNLIGGVLLAGDGTKLRAQNAKKNNYNERKIALHLAYITKKLAEYNAELAEADGDLKDELAKKIDQHKQQRTKYQEIQSELEKTGEKQLSTSDPDSRQIMVRGLINEVAYNVQSTVDAKNKLPIAYEVTNQNDKNALSGMVKTATEVLGTSNFEAVFDKGYHNAEEIEKCHQMGVEVYVAIPKPASNAPDHAFNLSKMLYNAAQDTYECPAGQTLETNGNWYYKKSYRVKQYKTSHCKICALKSRCTKAKGGRIIERHEFAEALERNRQAIAQKPAVYHQRQALVEHPFGTMKRAWGFDHIMTKKTIQHASADVGLMFIAYNLKRIINSIGCKALMRILGDFSLFKSSIKHQNRLQLLFKPQKLFFERIQKAMRILSQELYFWRITCCRVGF